MIEIQHRISLLAARPVSFSVQELRNGPMPQRPPASSAEAPLHVRHFSSNAANSRLSGALPNGPWSIKWSAQLPAEPQSVIRAGDRIIGQWLGAWRLYDAAGKQIHEGYCGRSPLVIDPASNTFELITDAVSWEVRHLESGELAFQNALPYSEDYSWPVLLRAGNRMLAFANVRPAFQHGPPEKGSSLLQLIELGTPVETDAGMLVRNLKRFETLQISAENSRAAAENDTIAMVAPGVLVRFDTNLQVKGVFSATFTPKQMSMDESGWMHLFVETNGARALWVIQPEGVRVASWSVPKEITDPIQPPILGYDRRIYHLSASQLVALNPQTQPQWIKPIPGGAVGGGVTADGQVLVTASNAVLAFQPNGDSTVLHRFEDRVSTPPVYTSHHEILVGAGRSLYCLAPLL